MTQQEKEEFEKSVAECVVATLPEVTLYKMDDAPDADLLHRDGFHVGMEIVRTMDQRYPETKKRLIAATESIRQELERRGVTGSFTIYFDLEEMSPRVDVAARRAWDRDAPGQIAEFFASRGDGPVEDVELQRHGISRIARIERRPSDKAIAGYGWRASASLRGTLADIALASKHCKLAKYRERNGERFHQYWLAIASIGPGTLDDGGFMKLLDRNFRTDFDRVLLIQHGSNGRPVKALDVSPQASVRPDEGPEGNRDQS